MSRRAAAAHASVVVDPARRREAYAGAGDRPPARPGLACLSDRDDARSMADTVANPDMLRALVREIEELRTKVHRQLSTIDKALAVARELADRVAANEVKAN
jgi:hypothetical protein